jgi:predicted NUDIX family NTP pyrophosphohydrolase
MHPFESGRANLAQTAGRANHNATRAAKREPGRNMKQSAGILLFRRRGKTVDLLLVHPGGPYWVNKDDGAWSIPKGLFEEGEEALSAAQREFEEETGFRPKGPFMELGAFKQPGGKRVFAWATEGEFDLASFRSNEFSMEWPPRSGRMRSFPEADRAGWFSVEEARVKALKGQRPIIEALLAKLKLPAVGQ